jgi:hypothetical protein
VPAAFVRMQHPVLPADLIVYYCHSGAVVATSQKTGTTIYKHYFKMILRDAQKFPQACWSALPWDDECMSSAAFLFSSASP